MNLYAVYLGGRATKCNTELHDVVFVVGEAIEDTYEQLLQLWFGSPEGLHIDSWMALDVVDGYRITVSPEPSTGEEKLFFVNLGAYRPGVFTELHANGFAVATERRGIIARAKSELLVGMDFVHTDDLFDIDDCIELSEVGGYRVHLEPTEEVKVLDPVNGYRIIPKELVAAFLQKRGRRE